MFIAIGPAIPSPHHVRFGAIASYGGQRFDERWRRFGFQHDVDGLREPLRDYQHGADP